MNDQGHRAVFLEDAEILSHQSHGSAQYSLRLRAPHSACHALPGSFVHLRCDPQLPMRRPLSIMRTNPTEHWVELLYKVVGRGTRLLSRRRAGEQLSLLGPIGRPFEPHPQRPRALLLGGGVGIPPMIFLADALRREPRFKPFAILGSEVPFPFAPRPSQHLIPDLPAHLSAAMPLLDDWGIPSRLTSLGGYPGCYQGYVTDLARRWLEGLNPTVRTQVAIFACGPQPMLAAVASLAREFACPCQVSLEEHMACAVGGCAGCVVQVQTADGPAMKRVCVDGPVFDAEAVFSPEIASSCIATPINP